MNSSRVPIIVLAVLIISAGVMVGLLVTAAEPTRENEQKAQFPHGVIVAKRDLPAYTLLTSNDVEVRQGLNRETPDVNKLTNHYLATSIKQGAEVKEQNLASASATEVLKDATAISISAPSTNFLGGQLRAGEIVGLTAVTKNVASAEKTPATTCEPLLVLNVVPPNKDTSTPGSITFAVPNTQRANFLAALANTDLLVTRTIAVQKQ